MINSTLCYIRRGDEYLLLHRTKKKNDINGGKWIGFGGKFEKDESPEDCLLREIYEETGLVLTDYSLRGVVTFVSELPETEYMFLYTADGFEGAPGECDEGEVAWIKKSDFLRLPHWKGDLIFLRLIETDMPFFSLKLVYKGDELVSAVLDGKSIELPD